jgi:hypothetical protein
MRGRIAPFRAEHPYLGVQQEVRPSTSPATSQQEAHTYPAKVVAILWASSCAFKARVNIMCDNLAQLTVPLLEWRLRNRPTVLHTTASREGTRQHLPVRLSADAFVDTGRRPHPAGVRRATSEYARYQDSVTVGNINGESKKLHMIILSGISRSSYTLKCQRNHRP